MALPPSKYGVLPLASILALASAALVSQTMPTGVPPLAYNIPDKVQPPSVEATGPVHVPGSSKEYDAARAASNANPPDWFPDEHGPAPGIVKGEAGAARAACGSCHLMSGQGHPESADIAGLPIEYFERQLNSFQSVARKNHGPIGRIAKATSSGEERQ